MNHSNLFNNLIEKGYAVQKNCIRKSLISSLKTEINYKLAQILKKNKKKQNKNIEKNFYSCLKLHSQHEIQIILANHLVEKKLITKVLKENKLINSLISLLGPDLEFNSEPELAINIKGSNDDYLVKKYHQEFWSGVGLSTLLIWIPIILPQNSGGVEIVEGSHKWGHIPHQNREPTNLPKNIKEKKIEVDLGSALIMTSFTLHRTVKSKVSTPRIALPIIIRNFYYPTTGNEDMWNFKKLQYSFYSKFRKILGNSQFSPFRTLNQKRKSIFDKEKINN